MRLRDSHSQLTLAAVIALILILGWTVPEGEAASGEGATPRLLGPGGAAPSVGLAGVVACGWGESTSIAAAELRGSGSIKLGVSKAQARWVLGARGARAFECLTEGLPRGYSGAGAVSVCIWTTAQRKKTLSARGMEKSNACATKGIGTWLSCQPETGGPDHQ